MSLSSVVVLVIPGCALVAGLVVVLVVLRGAARRTGAEVAASYPDAVAGPELGMYRGGDGDFTRVRSTGWVVLTPERLVVRPLTGSTITVPAGEITGSRVEKSFNTHWNGRPVLVVETRRGELGITVGDHPAWEAAIGRVAAGEDRGILDG